MSFLTELEFVLVCKLQRYRAAGAGINGLVAGTGGVTVELAMKKYFLMFALIGLFVFASNSQSLYERFPFKPQQFSVLLFGYSGNIQVEEFGSGSLFNVPISTNGQAIICLVTAKHCLSNSHTGKMLDGLLAKISMPHGSKPKYLKIPLKHDFPKSYWESPCGLDLVAIPLPASLIQGYENASFQESQIVTPQNSIEKEIAAGMMVEMFCMQFEYEDPIDYAMPETIPTARFGHLSRLGFYDLGNGKFNVRSHVIDMHSSPGNSGATVLVWVPRKDQQISEAMFLGIVQGFKDEQGSYVPYEAPVTNSSVHSTSINLVSEQNGATNQVAVALKTIANPNLTFIIPVHELVGLKDSREFQMAMGIALVNLKSYEAFDFLPPVGK